MTRSGPWPIPVLIGAATLAVFAMDSLTPVDDVVWILYLLPLVLAMWTPRPGTPLVLAAIATVLVVVGFFLSPPGVSPVLAALNRTMAVATFWATGWLLVLRQRSAVLLDGQRQVEKMVAIGATLPETLNAIVRFIEAQAPGMLGSILVLDEDGVHIRHGAAPSLPVEYVTAIDGVSIGPCVGSCGTAAYRKEAVFVADIAADPLWADYKGVALPHGLRACWSTPIFDAQGDVLGTFAMYYRRSGLPRPYHRRLIDVATHTAAIALMRHCEEAALRAKTEELDRYFTNSLDLLCIADTDGYFRRLNPEWERTLGYPLTALEGRRFLDFVHPDDLDATLDALRRLSSREQVLNFANRYRHNDGSYRWIEWRSYAEGKVIYAVARDITQRKQVEATLRKSQERLLLAMRTARMGSWAYDLDSGRFEADEAGMALHGLASGETITSLEEGSRHIHPDDLAEIQRRFEHAVQTQGTYENEYRVVLPDGGLRWIYSLGRIPEGSRYLIGMVQDISERKRAEDQLRERERQLSTLISNLPGAVYRIHNDPNYTAEYVSDGIADLTGYPADDFRENRRNFGELMHPDDREWVWNETEKAVGDHRPYEFSYRFIDAHGRERWNWERGRGIYDATGELQAIEGFVQDITERKHTEAALRESEANYRTLIESASDGIFVTDAQGRYLDVNTAGCLMLGYTPEEILGLSVSDIVATAQKPLVASELATLTAAKTLRREWQFRRKDGTLFFGEGSGTCLPDGRLLGILRDITESKQAEAALRESEARLRLAVAGGGVGLWEWDVATGQLIWDDRLKIIFGLPAEATGLTREKLLATIHPDDRAAVERTFRAGLEQHTEFKDEYRICRPDGTVRWIMAMGRGDYDALGKPLRMRGAALDITERKLAEEALRASEQRFATLFEKSAFVAALARTSDGAFVSLNEEFERVFGYTRQEALGRTSLELGIHPDAEDRARMLAALETQESMRGVELNLRTKAGETRTFLGNIDLVDIRGERYILSTLQDITERKQVERAVEESRQQLRQLAGSLLTARENERAAIARDLHDDLGQVLSAIKMDVAWLGRHVSDPEGRLRPKIGDLSELANTAIRTVQQLATEFRPGSLDDLGLAAAIEWSVGEFRKRTGVSCACRLRETRLDLSRQTSIALYRIVQECLTNIGRHAQATRVRVVLAEINGHLILEVADNGRGITQDDLRRARSIGLAGMRERAELVGGTCAISGEPGKGTTVRVDVPLDAARSLP